MITKVTKFTGDRKTKKIKLKTTKMSKNFEI